MGTMKDEFIIELFKLQIDMLMDLLGDNPQYKDRYSKILDKYKKEKNKKLLYYQPQEQVLEDINNLIEVYKGSKSKLMSYISFLAEQNKNKKLTLTREYQVIKEIFDLSQEIDTKYIDIAIDRVITKNIDNINYLKTTAKGISKLNGVSEKKEIIDDFIDDIWGK
jgi:uncharacterized coiled-coil DUF342 family protein